MKITLAKVVIASGLLISVGAIQSVYAESTRSAKVIKPVTSVKTIDLPKYLGRWYEIARLPMFFERHCAAHVTATYSLNPDSTIKVDNQCQKKNGDPMQSIGQAAAVDESHAKLSVTFLPSWLRWTGLAKAPYWVLKIDDNYTTALVGEPSRKYLWILSRTPQISPAIYQEYVAEAQRQGFDTSQLIVTKQD
ncbi:MAG: lipocalin family protein [Candidatus Saccharibacteria bacterium]|nr:lipocalin family protein [Moraxellaceae bacterium]